MLKSLKCFSFLPRLKNKAALAGIYSIQHRFKKTLYIGSSNDINRRWSLHKRDLLMGKHHNKKMQFDFDFFDREQSLFEYKILRVYSGFWPLWVLHIIEQSYIERYSKTVWLYNEANPAKMNFFKRALVVLIDLID